jgi:proteic killer suppression protein
MSRHKAALLTEYDRGTQAALPFPPTATTETAASAVDEAMGGDDLERPRRDRGCRPINRLSRRSDQRRAQTKLMMLNSARDLNDLRVPPGNRLEALSGVRKGQYSIRINKRWRICFSWRQGDACRVEIVDYH